MGQQAERPVRESDLAFFYMPTIIGTQDQDSCPGGRSSPSAEIVRFADLRKSLRFCTIRAQPLYRSGSTGIQYWHSVLAFGIVAHSFVDQQKRIGKAECRKSPEVGHQACLARFPIG